MRAERDCRDYVCTLQRNAKQRSAVSELEARQAGGQAGKQASRHVVSVTQSGMTMLARGKCSAEGDEFKISRLFDDKLIR